MAKIKRCISIDEDVWEKAGGKLENRSAFIENQLRLAVDLANDEEDELLKKKKKKREEINVLEDELCSYRKKRLKKSQENHLFDTAMISINRLYTNLGEVGKNQIKNIARSNHIPYDLLLNHCYEQNIKIVNFGAVPKK